MKRRSFKILWGLVLAAGMLLSPFADIRAEDGLEKGYTYNYDYWKEIQYSPDAYSTVGVYTAAELGLEKNLSSPQGMYVQGKEVYICDTGNNRILQLNRTSNEKFELVRIIDEIKGCDNTALSEPTDISVDEDGIMYICDKGNNRILKIDKDLNYLMEFGKPTDATFDQSLSFLPDKLVVDGAGRVYCIADNVNKGIVKYENDGTFTGFYGASQVTYDWTDYIWKKFSTQAQRAALESFVPTEYDNVYMDSEGFIFTCTTNVSANGIKSDEDEPIRRLNLMGNNILITNGNFRPIGDVYWGKAGGYNGPSLIADVTALENGIYFGIDRVRGRLFAYDTQGNLLYAFGGNGNQDGYFKRPEALEHMGKDLLVLDSQDASFTVFTPTVFGNKIYQAIAEYDHGDYEKSGETWREVMNMNGNYDQAYIGIGRALMRQGEYKEAMKYFRLKWDDDNYSKAFKQYRKEWVEEHIGWIFLAVFLLFILPMIVGRVKKVKFQIDTAEIFKS